MQHYCQRRTEVTYRNFGEIWTFNRADRQTNRHRNTMITILRTPVPGAKQLPTEVHQPRAVEQW